MTRNQSIVDASGGGFATIVGSIYERGVEEAVPWLIAMVCVVVVDLFAGVRCAWLMGERIRWSTGVRRTLSKLITYISFVVCAVMINVASNTEFDIAKWACLFICSVEGFSVAENIIKPHGYSINLQALAKSIGKRYGVDADGVIKKTRKMKK